MVALLNKFEYWAFADCPHHRFKKIGSIKRIRFTGCFLTVWFSLVGMATLAANPFVGNWSLTLPDGGVGWLGIIETNDTLRASVMWETGSIEPVSRVTLDGDILERLPCYLDDPPRTLNVKSNQLVLVREYQGSVQREGKFIPVKEIETIHAIRMGSHLQLVSERTRDGVKLSRVELTGEWIPPLPPEPNLTKVKFGSAIILFNGENLDGWKMVDPQQLNGWTVQAAVLANIAEQKAGETWKVYGNLRTKQEFEDFRLTCETRVPRHGNSGIYLRGIYEVQVADTFGKKCDTQSMGAIYGRIEPIISAEKRAGEWQTLVITLVARHVTVVLNGITIIDNQPLQGCTGGALWGDEFRPGPICLQGDHSAIEFRNLTLEPVVGER